MAGLFSFKDSCYTEAMPQKKSTPQIRVRFAPSPTGFLHIGSLRTALYNYLFAQHHGGEFIVRIEDTDRTRTVPDGVENIIQTIRWCELSYDEGPVLDRNVGEIGEFGPYVQSARLEIYKKYAERLVEKGKAYYCTCIPERLEQVRREQMARKEPTHYDGKCRDANLRYTLYATRYTVRLKVPGQGSTKFSDIIRGEVEFENALIDDQVLMKSDGYPTYHLANVVDDHLMKITHVIRGEEWLSSTPKHILLYKAFGWKPPQFAHLPLLLNSDHSKLSKRQGDVAVEDYIKKGYLPEALLNFVALLGFNPRANQELYTVAELITEFDLSKVNKSGAVVNFEKLDWMNGAYIRQKPLNALVALAMPFLPTDDRELARKVIALEQERLRKLSDLNAGTEFFFVDQPQYEPAILVWKKGPPANVAPNLTLLHAFLLQYDGEWEAASLEQAIKVWVAQAGKGVGEILWPLRVALSGREASPPPFEIAAILGKDKTLKRIRYAIESAKKL